MGVDGYGVIWDGVNVLFVKETDLFHQLREILMDHNYPITNWNIPLL